MADLKIETNYIPLGLDVIPEKEGMAIGDTPAVNSTPVSIEGNIGGVMAMGVLNSSNYIAGVAGWKIDANGDVEFSKGTFRADIAIGSGNAIFKADSNGIYLGHAVFASAPFSVSMAGALVASSATITGSLEHNNITWVTLFDSIDGYKKDVGAGTIALEDVGSGQTIGVRLTTGATTNDVTRFSKSSWSGLYTFTKDLKIRFSFISGGGVPLTITNETIYLTIGLGGTSAHIGFKIVDDGIFGSCADGSTQSLTSSIYTFSQAEILTCVAKLISGTEVQFIVTESDGTEHTATLSTNLPSVSAGGSVMYVSATTNENVAKAITITHWEVWNGI